jgi:hypothetical protein
MLAFEIVGKILIEGSDKVRAELEKSGVSAKEAADQVKVLEKQLADLEKVANVVGKGMIALGTTIIAAAGMATKAAIEVESTTIAFENLSTSAGQVSEDILSALQDASAGTVAANKLMLAANRAMVLGVADNTEEFTVLMEIARDRARAMGLTIEQAFNDIVTGIGRGSPLILDNLGLVINQVEANEDYAFSLGKTAEELTEAEKKQALLNAVLEQGQKTIDKNTQAELTASETIQALKANFADVTAEIGESFLPIVKDVSEWVINIVNNFQEWRRENPQLATSIDKVAVALGGAAIVVGTLIVILPKLKRGIDTVRNAYLAFKAITLATNPVLLAAVAAIASVVAIVGTVKWKIDELTEAERRNKAMIEDLNKTRESYTKQIAENEEQLKTEIRTLEDYQDNLAKAEKSLADLRAEQNEALDSMNKTTATIEQLNQLYDQTAGAINAAQQEVDTWTGMVNYQQGIVDNLTTSLEDANDALEAAQDEYDKATDKVDEYSAALSDLERQINDLSRVRIEGMGEYEDKIHSVETEIDKTKLAIWEAEQAGQDTTALESQLDALQDQLKGLRLQYDVAYNDALYQQQKAAEEALGQDTEMSIDDILSGIISAGEDYAAMSELLADALSEQEAAGQGVEEAEAVVDAAEEVLATAVSTLDLYQGYLDTANANLTALEESATNIFNNLMGITSGQSEILNKITAEVINQEELYNKIKDETLPGLQESISDYQRIVSRAYESVNDQTNAVNNLIKATEDLLTASEGLKQLYLIAGAWEMVDASPDVIGSVTPYASGGLIKEPTLLTSLATGRPYAIAGEAGTEHVVPEGKMGGTIVNNYTVNAVIREESDIKKVARELYKLQESGNRGVGYG